MKKVIMMYALMVAGIMLLPFTAGAAEIVNIDFESASGYTLDADIPTGSPLSGGEQWALQLEDGSAFPGASAGSVKIKAPVAPTPSQWNSQCVDFETIDNTLSSAMMLKESNSLSAGYDEATLDCDLILIDLPEDAFNVRFMNASGQTITACAVRNTGWRFTASSNVFSTTEPAPVVNTLYRINLNCLSGTGVSLKITKDPYGTNETIFEPAAGSERNPGPAVALGITCRAGYIAHTQIDNIVVFSGGTAVGDWMMFD